MAPRTPPKAHSFVSVRDIWNKRDAEKPAAESTALSPCRRSKSSAPLPSATPKMKKKKKKTAPSSLLGTPSLGESPPRSEKSHQNSPTRSKSFGEVYSVKIPKPTAGLGRCMSLPCDTTKSVCFNDKDQICEIEKIDELPESVILSLWWSEGDYVEMRQGWEMVLYLLESGKPVCEQTLSARGLQKRTDTGAWELYEIQRDARNAVFEVQDKQRKTKARDPVEIAAAYMQHTAKSQQEAYDQAALDAKDADRIKKKKRKKSAKSGAKEGLPPTGSSPKKKAEATSPKRSPIPKSPKQAPPCVLRDSFLVKSPLSPTSPKSRSTTTTINTVRKPATRARTIRFSDDLAYIKAKKLKDAEKAMKRRWITELELKSIEKGYKAVVKQMEKGGAIEETEDQTTRGLENETKEGQKRLLKHRKAAVDAVLGEQAEQKGKKMPLNNEAISEVYESVTADAAKRASKQGKLDAKEARRNRVRRRSIGELDRKISSDAITKARAAFSSAQSVSTEEASVEPEFVRMAKNRRARRASCTDATSFRQNHSALDVVPGGEQAREQEATPTLSGSCAVSPKPTKTKVKIPLSTPRVASPTKCTPNAVSPNSTSGEKALSPKPVPQCPKPTPWVRSPSKSPTATLSPKQSATREQSSHVKLSPKPTQPKIQIPKPTPWTRSPTKSSSDESSQISSAAAEEQSPKPTQPKEQIPEPTPWTRSPTTKSSSDEPSQKSSAKTKSPKPRRRTLSPKPPVSQSKKSSSEAPAVESIPWVRSPVSSPKKIPTEAVARLQTPTLSTECTVPKLCKDVQGPPVQHTSPQKEEQKSDCSSQESNHHVEEEEQKSGSSSQESNDHVQEQSACTPEVCDTAPRVPDHSTVSVTLPATAQVEDVNATVGLCPTSNVEPSESDTPEKTEKLDDTRKCDEQCGQDAWEIVEHMSSHKVREVM